MPHATLLLVADDLTGAADCAAYAPELGLPAQIHVGALPMLFRQGLHAFSTDSRALAPAASSNAMYRALALWPTYPGDRCFKKIDSQLRGNVGAEVEAMLRGLRQYAALICPALPAQGRSVVDRRLLGASTPIDVAQTVAAQTNLPIAMLGLETVRGSKRALGSAVAEATANADLIVADAETDADLDALVAAWRKAIPNGLLCGSAGLAAAWLRARRAKAPPTPLPPGATPPIDFAVIGSASAMAHAQIDVAAAFPSVQAIELREGTPVELAPGATYILHLPRPEGAPTPAASAAAASALAQAACVAMTELRANHVLVSGGETAQVLLPLLGITRLDVLEARAAGMPTCRAQRAAGDPLWITLKAGNHGRPDTLAALLQRGT